MPLWLPSYSSYSSSYSGGYRDEFLVTVRPWSLSALQWLVLYASIFFLCLNRIPLFIFGILRGPYVTRLKGYKTSRGQLKTQLDIDLSFNRYHHLKCRIPTTAPHPPTIAPHRLTGLPPPTISRRPSVSHRPIHLLSACRPQATVRSLQVRSPIQPPSDQMERPSTIRSSTLFILLYLLGLRSHLRS